MSPRILLMDIETSPFVGWTWGKYQQDVIDWVDYSQIICISWKWLGESEVYAYSQDETKGYRAGKLNDKLIVRQLWDLLDKADVVIAHNGDRFDTKVANARFVFHELKPPAHYKTIDTKKVAKKTGMFPSNKLGELGPYLHVGNKMDTGGFSLWKECMAGDLKAWEKMREYNKQDVILLERVYLKLRPWMTNHPNMNQYHGERVCPNCGSHRIQKRGIVPFGRTSRVQRYQCMSCGGWGQGPAQRIEDLVVR